MVVRFYGGLDDECPLIILVLSPLGELGDCDGGSAVNCYTGPEPYWPLDSLSSIFDLSGD